jgi:hypothetical protein
MEPTPNRQIRALFDDETIAVYQAYAPEIAEPALAAGTFVPPFGLNRMTWIKPSFLWMAYRSGWATKPGQTRVLRIHLKRCSIQIGLSPEAVHHYVHDWITTIEDATPAMHQIHDLAQTNPAEAHAALPTERPYPLPLDLATHIGATPAT